MTERPRLQFGRNPPAGLAVVAAFGARCILDQRLSTCQSGGKPYIDWVPDRKDAWPNEMPRAFKDWVNFKGGKWVNELPNSRENLPLLRGDSHHVFTLDDGPYHAEACCQGSHGYLYVGMWQVPVTTTPQEAEHAEAA